MNIDLEDLLQRWDYEKAKDFYLVHGESQTVIRMLNGTKNAYVEKRLRQEIQKIHQIHQQTNPPFFAHKPHPKNSSIVKKGHEVEDANLQEITRRWKRNYKQASRLQMTLEQASDDEVRRKMAFEILDLMDKVYDDWDNINYYKVHGCFLPDSIEVSLDNFDKADLMQRLRSLRTYLAPSKNKDYSDEQRAEFQAEIDHIAKVLIEIDTN